MHWILDKEGSTQLLPLEVGLHNHIKFGNPKHIEEVIREAILHDCLSILEEELYPNLEVLIRNSLPFFNEWLDDLGLRRQLKFIIDGGKLPGDIFAPQPLLAACKFCCIQFPDKVPPDNLCKPKLTGDKCRSKYLEFIRKNYNKSKALITKLKELSVKLPFKNNTNSEDESTSAISELENLKSEVQSISKFLISRIRDERFYKKLSNENFIPYKPAYSMELLQDKRIALHFNIYLPPNVSSAPEEEKFLSLNEKEFFVWLEGQPPFLQNTFFKKFLWLFFIKKRNLLGNSEESRKLATTIILEPDDTKHDALIAK